ncbi:MAG: hypothetical protein N2V75_00675 [Methanophagales archaeon]|nr:hypothetical protein [Methanophagales archaeon]
MKKKIAIAGMGVAGSFLLRLLLQRGYAPDSIGCFEVKQRSACGIAPCAFGIAKKQFVDILKNVDLDATNYILSSFNKILIDDTAADCDLCMINKPQLLKDLIGEHPVKILNSEERIDTSQYDMVVDATGYKRVYLPPIENDLIIPTIQYKIKTEEYEYLPLTINHVGIGYGWIFPLADNEYHIGMGCLKCNLMERFKELYHDIISTSEVICGCKSYVRLLPPRYAMPIVHKNIVGVGESVGTVAPLCGAGIIASMESALLLSENIEDIYSYERAMLKHFRYLNKEFKVLRKMMDGKEPNIIDVIRLFPNSRRVGLFAKLGTSLKLRKEALRKEAC